MSSARRDNAYADLAPRVAELRAEELSFRQIAVRLNAEGHMTKRGMRVLVRAGE